MTYPIEIQEIKERFYRQAYETLYDNLFTVKGGEVMNAFNRRIDSGDYSPTLTTRCEGFKTAILLIVKE